MLRCGVYIVMTQGGRLCYDECNKLRGGGRLTVCMTALESAEERRRYALPDDWIYVVRRPL